MNWKTLRAAKRATRIEFAPWLAAAHVFVKLPTGRWGRYLRLESISQTTSPLALARTIERI